LHIWEVVKGKGKRTSTVKRSRAGKVDVRTEFEKNATELRSRERKLKPQLPVKPVKHKG